MSASRSVISFKAACPIKGGKFDDGLYGCVTRYLLPVQRQALELHSSIDLNSAVVSLPRLTLLACSSMNTLLVLP